MRRWIKSGLENACRLLLAGAFFGAAALGVSASDSSDPAGVYRCGSAGSECGEGPRVALTFDDGPHPVFTPQILDLLAENGIHATFFVVGENVRAHPELLERTLKEGHEIGNHTYDHAYLKGKARDTQEREIDLCDYEIFDHSEYCAHLLRPPGGLFDDNVVEICSERGYKIIIWSIDTRDWTGVGADTIVRTVMDGLEDGAIILMHDFNRTDSHTVEALRALIPRIRDAGYEFVTVSEILE